jgi:hypothetical protein
LLVDRVVKYESLDEGLDIVSKESGMPRIDLGAFNAKGGIRKDRRHYRDVFNQEQRRIIENEYGTEIDMHGYSY